MKDTPTREEAVGIVVLECRRLQRLPAHEATPIGVMSGVKLGFSAGESFARETLAKSMIAMGLPTGHGDTIEDLCAELRTEWEELRSRYTEQARQSILKEMEEAFDGLEQRLTSRISYSQQDRDFVECQMCHREWLEGEETDHAEDCPLGILAAKLKGEGV